ncbi:myopalladin isoform X2 [Carcharodon carcharias]|uniref:myopalladin isoform X2 n=1 Tax=Carcharodon carcharias TaxID=13397 RepID=UPI001B7EB247|nr:myopalladin isoform X2 [Carcharodon carcharias]
MQEDNFEASTSISQLLRESYLAEVRIHQEHGEKSRSEVASQHFYYGSKSGVSQDLDGQDESPDLSAFLSQEELDKSVNLAQQAIAQCSHEVKKDEKQINVSCPNKDLYDTLRPAGNRKVLESASSSGFPEKLNNQSYHCEYFTKSPNSSKETHRESRKPSKNSPYSTETEAKKDYLSKAADFIEELSSLFKTTSTKRIKPKTCKNTRSRAQTKSHSQAQYSSWSVDERERTHVPFSVQVYEETIPKEESEEIAQAPVLSAGSETLTAEAKTTETQSRPFYIEGTEGNPPRFIQRLKSREAAEGSRVQLDCVVTGLPTPEVRWYCEGKELKNSPDFQIGYDGNHYLLTISEAFEEDTGRYTCLASNIYGSDTTSAELYIEGLSSSESEPDSVKEDMTQVQDKIHITVAAPSPPSNPATVHSEFHQLHPTVDPPPVRPIHQIQSPTNLLQGLDGLPLMAAPVFTKPLQEVTAKEGQLVVLECRIKGVPFPKMEWYREETLIEDSPDFRILQKKPRSMSDSEEICTLVIAEAFPEDSGMFTCTASNKYGTMSSTAQLTVHGTEDSNVVSMNVSSSVTVEATEANVPVQPDKTLLRPTARLKPKLEGVLVNHHDHKPKAGLRVHFKLPEDDTGSEPSFQREHNTTNGQSTWASGPISPTKEPPPVFAKPKLDPVQLQQLHNQVLLEQQQEVTLQQPPSQSLSLSSSLPTAFQPTMNVVNSAPHPPVQPSPSSKSPTPKNTLPQAFNYARPKQFITTQNVVRSYSPSLSPVSMLSTGSEKTEKQCDEENYFGFPLTPAYQGPIIYPSKSLPSPASRSSSATSTIGQAISSTISPLPNFQPQIVSPTSINAGNSCPSPVQNPVAFLSSVLPSLPSAPSTNAMGLPKSAPAIPPQGILKKVLKSPLTSTSDEICKSKDTVIHDLDRKLHFKEEVFQTGQQEYKVSSFEQRLMNEIEFRLERTPVDESDDEIQHEDIPTGKCIAPIFDKKLKHFRVVEGSPVTMSCKLLGIPVPKVYWFKDGKQISKKNEHFKMKRDGDGACSLHIESATNDDDGNYTVMAVNPQGRNSSSGHLMIQNTPIRGRIVPSVQSQRTRSRVLEGEEPVQERFFCPHFLQAPGDMIAHEGQICRLDCKVSGLPNPDLIWLLNGKPILLDVTHKMLVRENGIHSLLIDHLTAGDAGTYTCIATNKAGQSSFSLELSVVAKNITKVPIFIEKLRNTGVPEGHPVRIECRVVGMPPPLIFWKKDNETISPNRNRISMHQDTTGYVCLLIQPTKKEDAGWYTVSAKNEAGIASCTARLDLYAQWHQQITQPIKQVRPSGNRYAALTGQGLDFKSAFSSGDSSQFPTKHGVMESDEL